MYKTLKPIPKKINILDNMPDSEKRSLMGNLEQPVDPFYKQDFVKGENGFVMNDIELIRRASSEQAAEMLVQRLQQREASYLADGISFDDAVRDCIPRNCQSFTEIERFINYRLEYQRKLDDFKKSLDEKDGKIKFEKDDSDSSN